MIRFIPVLLASLAATLAVAQQMPSKTFASAETVVAERFRAPGLVPSQHLSLAAPQQELVPGLDDRGRLRIASARPLPKASTLGTWSATADGYVTRLVASSEGSQGLRVRLDLGAIAAPIEVRVQGSDDRIESTIVDP